MRQEDTRARGPAEVASGSGPPVAPGALMLFGGPAVPQLMAVTGRKTLAFARLHPYNPLTRLKLLATFASRIDHKERAWCGPGTRIAGLGRRIDTPYSLNR